MGRLWLLIEGQKTRRLVKKKKCYAIVFGNCRWSRGDLELRCLGIKHFESRNPFFLRHDVASTGDRLQTFRTNTLLSKRRENQFRNNCVSRHTAVQNLTTRKFCIYLCSLHTKFAATTTGTRRSGVWNPKGAKEFPLLPNAQTAFLGPNHFLSGSSMRVCVSRCLTRKWLTTGLQRTDCTSNSHLQQIMRTIFTTFWTTETCICLVFSILFTVIKFLSFWPTDSHKFSLDTQ